MLCKRFTGRPSPRKWPEKWLRETFKNSHRLSHNAGECWGGVDIGWGQQVGETQGGKQQGEPSVPYLPRPVSPTQRPACR